MVPESDSTGNTHGGAERRGRIIRAARLILALALLGCGLYAGTFGIGTLPPLGPFLDPANGIWAVARSAVLPTDLSVRLPALGDSVRVVYDRRAVPHIWAQSAEDAMRALGYVVARDRLFQMELQARAGSGQLTELVGAAALPADRHQRAIGLPWGAERELESIGSDSEEMGLIRAYAEGVNGWIDAMARSDLPFEYRLLGKRPRHWEPLHTVHVIKRMGYTLAYSSHDRQRQRLDSLIGAAATDALFPINSPIQQPIQPNGAEAPRLDFAPLPEPVSPPRESRPVTVGMADVPSFHRSAEEMGEAVGSNNWAVSPVRTADGFALLAGDPHLQLTLPSIWYEVHIVVPGLLDVYGATIPGIPGIVIGFNRDVAWSFTNVGADVLDYYREVVDQVAQPTEYNLDGEWLPLERRVEEFHGKDGELLAVDTVLYTHRGPIVERDPAWLSMRWTVLEPSGAVTAFLGANRARSVAEWLSAMEHFAAPPQNGVVADREGNIAIRSIGHYPIRPGDGDGTAVRVGVVTANDWRGYWPVEEYPQSTNPAQGFIASANQQPIDPSVDGTYLGVDWVSPWRAMRINELLGADSQVTAQSMSRYQTDPGSTRADLFVPELLAAAARVLERESDETLAEAAALLGEWDRKYTKDNRRAVLFEAVMEELTDRVWDELETAGGRRVATPGDAVLLQLIAYPESGWWDVLDTEDTVEQRDEVLAASLTAGFERSVARYGPPDQGGWRWDRAEGGNVYHLLGIPALSALQLPVQGGPATLNPSTGRGGFGASWRMVVALGPSITASTTYPGGQSGNPASHWYDNRVSQWSEGLLERVLFPLTAGELAGSAVAGRLLLSPTEDER